MRDGEKHAQRTRKVGQQVLEHVTYNPRRDAGSLDKCHFTQTNLVDSRHRSRSDRRNSWPVPMVAISKVVNLLSRPSNRSNKANKSTLKGDYNMNKHNKKTSTRHRASGSVWINPEPNKELDARKLSRAFLALALHRAAEEADAQAQFDTKLKTDNRTDGGGDDECAQK